MGMRNNDQHQSKIQRQSQNVSSCVLVTEKPSHCHEFQSLTGILSCSMSRDSTA